MGTMQDRLSRDDTTKRVFTAAEIVKIPFGNDKR